MACGKSFACCSCNWPSFGWAPDYIQRLEKTLLGATQAHLEELYALLIAPIRDQLTAEHLIIVPHAFLHYLPFHALSDGKRYLIDDFSVSYAPSSSIFAVCQEKAVGRGWTIRWCWRCRTPGLHLSKKKPILWLPPWATQDLFLGRKPPRNNCGCMGLRAGSSILPRMAIFVRTIPCSPPSRLGNSLLSLFDLYQLQFDAELVTLSGCGTGMNVVIGGDELIGLVRGLLYAGAQTLMVSLWEVHDQSTAEFMRDFYEGYKSRLTKRMHYETQCSN